MPSSAQDVRAKFKRFRILVGRANAGKTTLLRKVYNATGKPEIFDDLIVRTQNLLPILWSISDPSHSPRRGSHLAAHENIKAKVVPPAFTWKRLFSSSPPPSVPPSS
ncbi:hypothetical protein M405DRAFT_829133, partial [Rhizopogon salebrosus TDB-379]